jgi:hypothetical protein
MGSKMADLSRVSVWVTTATWVTCDPVPEVVLTAMTGRVFSVGACLKKR